MKKLLLLSLTAACICFLSLAEHAQVSPVPEADDVFIRARKLFEEGKFEESLALLRQGEKAEPKRADIQIGLGNVLVNLKRFEDAAAAFGRVVKVLPDDPRGHFGLCMTFPKIGKRIEAVDACREAVRLDPTSGEYHAALARAYTANNRTMDTLRLLEAVIERFHNDIQIIGLLADAYRHAADWPHAAEYYSRVSQLAPRLSFPYLGLAESLANLDRQNEAIAAARKYTELEPTDAGGFLNLGRIQLEAGFFHESIEPLSRSIDLKCACEQAYLLLAEVHETLGDRDGALTVYRAAYSALPPSFSVSYLFGRSLTSYGRMAEAVAPLEKANALKPDDVGTMVSLGLAYFESNQFEKAIPMLTKADGLRPADETIQMFLRVARARLSVRDRLREYIDAAERNPGDKKALIRLADAYRYSGKPDMAEAQYRAAIKIDPRDFNLYNLQGIYFSDTGQKEKALDSYRTAAQLSNNHVIYLALSDAFERLGRLEEAVSAARRSVELKSTLLVSHLALGDLLNKQGKRDETVQAYEAAYALNAGDPRPNFRLAWFYIKTGNKEGAIRHYDILRSLAPNDVGPLGRCIRAHFGR